MNRIFFALCLFLALVLSTAAPATAQFGPSQQVYVFTPEVSADGTVALRVYTTQCTQLYQFFFALSRAEASGRLWVDILGVKGEPLTIPVGLEPLSPAISVRRSLNLKLPAGTYKLTPTQFSRYGNADRNVDEKKYCTSSLRDYVQNENIVFTVGGQSEAVDLPVILMGDQYAALKEKVVRFWALLPNATRLIFSQENAKGEVRYFIVDQPATHGDFQQISVDLPDSFDGSLPIEVYARDKRNDMSTARQVLERNPVLATSVARTNR